MVPWLIQGNIFKNVPFTFIMLGIKVHSYTVIDIKSFLGHRDLYFTVQ